MPKEQRLQKNITFSCYVLLLDVSKLYIIKLTNLQNIYNIMRSIDHWCARADFPYCGLLEQQAAHIILFYMAVGFAD